VCTEQPVSVAPQIAVSAGGVVSPGSAQTRPPHSFSRIHIDNDHNKPANAFSRLFLTLLRGSVVNGISNGVPTCANPARSGSALMIWTNLRSFNAYSSEWSLGTPNQARFTGLIIDTPVVCASLDFIVNAARLVNYELLRYCSL
jgi:hypothetical protein